MLQTSSNPHDVPFMSQAEEVLLEQKDTTSLPVLEYACIVPKVPFPFTRESLGPITAVGLREGKGLGGACGLFGNCECIDYRDLFTLWGWWPS